MNASGAAGPNGAGNPNGDGFRWPKKMVECPAYLPAVLFGLTGLVGLWTGFVAGWALFAWIVAAVLLFVVAALLTVAREWGITTTSADRDQWLERARAGQKAAMKTLLGDELRNLIHLVAEAMASTTIDERRSLSASARQSIICAASAMVGRNAPAGSTRANLFRLSDDQTSMTLEPNGFFGRGDQSSRVFRTGDDTFDRVIENKVRWVPSVRDVPSLAVQGLRYGTFLVHPVSIGDSHIHGALTVDCLGLDDLDQDVDTPMMAVLSTLIAMTYECEKYPNQRRQP